jgi:hypothetical protein
MNGRSLYMLNASSLFPGWPLRRATATVVVAAFTINLTTLFK